jgi:potassium-transporting ATPase KdpC subunit
MKEFVRALLVFAMLSLLTGLIYPLVITGLSQLAFPEKAQGSLIRDKGGNAVGSALIGQQFTNPKYFYPRPSALEKPYDAGNSGGSNSGPSNAKFLEEVVKKIDRVRRENAVEPATPIPADMVLSSGSGLDPHISLDAALIQVARVAKARGLPEAKVKEVVYGMVEAPLLGFIGQERINVLRLNLALEGLRAG